MAYVYTRSWQAQPIAYIVRIIWYVLDIVLALLLIRFLLRLLNANPNAGFTQIIHSITQPLVTPFQNLVSPSSSSGYVFEWTTLIAMVVFWIIAYALVRLLALSQPYSAGESS